VIINHFIGSLYYSFFILLSVVAKISFHHPIPSSSSLTHSNRYPHPTPSYVLYSTLLYSTLLYSTLLYSTLLYSTVFTFNALSLSLPVHTLTNTQNLPFPSSFIHSNSNPFTTLILLHSFSHS
jgi:hypothetical protein